MNLLGLSISQAATELIGQAVGIGKGLEWKTHGETERTFKSQSLPLTSQKKSRCVNSRFMADQAAESPELPCNQIDQISLIPGLSGGIGGISVFGAARAGERYVSAYASKECTLESQALASQPTHRYEGTCQGPRRHRVGAVALSSTCSPLAPA
jgi:hypothetical protein